jgi:Flp pilus assembly protein TadG
MAFLRRRSRSSSGNAVIEFALILPLLLLVVFGITEFGRAWFVVNVLATGAREGARLAVVTGPDVSAVVARVEEVLGAAVITPTSVTVTGPEPGDPARRVTVTVRADFTVIPGNLLGTFSGTLPLQASTSMRHEAF